MSSSRALFGDSSSSSDEDETPKDSAAKEPKESKDSAKDEEETKEETAKEKKDDSDDDDDLLDDDDDDDDGDVEKEEETKANEPEKEANAKPAPSTSNLFGDDSDDDEDDVEFDDKGDVVGVSSKTMGGDVHRPSVSSLPPARTGPPRGDDSEAEEEERQQQENREQQASPERKPETVNWTVPEMTRPDPAPSTKLQITKLPNIVGIQTQAFDPNTYDIAAEEEYYGAAVHNLMRWRYKRKGTAGSSGPSNPLDDSEDLERDAAGKLLRESNTRLVQWDDGSWTLHVGKEAFEIDTFLAPKTNADENKEGVYKFPGINGYLYLSQKATAKTAKDNEDGDDGSPEEEATEDTVLECMGPMASRWTIRPSSLQSEAHKSLTVAVRQKTIKKARIAEVVTQEDPEKLKQERIRVKQDLDKVAKNKRSRASGGYGGGGGYRRPRMNRAYLEEDDRDFDTTDIKAMKRRAFEDDMDDYGEDMDDDDDEEEEDFKHAAKRKKSAAAAAKEESSDDDDIVMGDDDDEEEEETFVVKKHAKRSNQAVLDDDDDSD